MTAKILKGPQLEFAPNITLGQLFFDFGEKFSEKTCQIDANTNRSETYSLVKQKSTRMAIEMQRRGITSRDVIVSCSAVTLETSIPLLAAFYLGAKVANLDPGLSIGQTKHLLSLVSPKMIFVEEACLGLIEESLKSLDFETEVVVLGVTSDFDKPSPNEEEFKPLVVDLDDAAIIFFSSGTTGLPKGICHSHRSFVNLLYSFYQGSVNFKTILSFTSFYWISGMMLLSCAFISGGRRILCRSTVEAEKTFRIIKDYEVTYLFLAPILTYKLTNFDKYKNYDTSSLQTILTGGTPISATQFLKLGTVFNNSSIIFIYGQSECGIVSLFHPVRDQNLAKEKIGSVGKPAGGFTVKVVDIETEEILGPNQKGEIRVKSPSVMKGYYDAESSQVFDQDGFLKTGDIGYYDSDGCLYFVERMKEMFKYLSWHIVPTLIEAVLLEHPCIRDAVVFGLPKSEEEGEIPTACVVLKDGTVSAKEIQDFIAGKVSDREKLRGGVFFLEELERTATGKLKRREIRDYVIKHFL